jgi:hypothetical protein
MSGGRAALAVRLHPQRGVEVLVRQGQATSWVSGARALTATQTKRWLEHGFE